MSHNLCAVVLEDLADATCDRYLARVSWTDQLLARRPTNVVLVAMANKTARVAWALLHYERIYQPVSA